jgi:hypothetical protein
MKSTDVADRKLFGEHLAVLVVEDRIVVGRIAQLIGLAVCCDRSC